MHAVTIAARNYLATARALAKSFKETNPGHNLTILVVDAQPNEITPTDHYRIATPHTLSLSAEEFGRMALLYDVTELSTALKPWALEMLLDNGADVAMYLDPDILVYASLDEIENLSLAHGIVLTPHTTGPMLRDGLRPTEADIMGAGTFNLGFIAVGKSNRPMLHWWQERLRRDSISAPEKMLFTDQRWIDLVPSYFDHYILRGSGYNVAYWNLDHRQVTMQDDRYLVDSYPLRFFHFSGYRPETPWLLSKYVADHPRVVLSEHPVVARLCQSYSKALYAEDFDTSSKVVYRFNSFRDGSRITQPMRRIYRTAVLNADEQHQEYPPAPSELDSDQAIIAWFREPIGPARLLNRLTYGIWQLRTDLQIAFPDPFGVDGSRLLEWCSTQGVAENQLAPSLLPSSQQPGTLSVRNFPPAADVRGVNVAGYFQAEMGVGQIGRLLLDAVKAAGVPYSTIRAVDTVSRQQANFDDSAETTRYRVNIVSVNADQLPTWVRQVGGDILRDRYTIGVWAWEVEEFPAESLHALNLVNEIWAISSFVKEAIEAKTTKPVFVIPYQASVLPPHISLDRTALNLPDGPYFLFMFDYLSVFERKNPLGVIAAFTAAFQLEGEAVLVIKSINGDRFRSQREQLRHAAAERQDIIILEDYLDQPVVTALSANAVAYVSLHRAEGLGLTLSEAMSAGRPVIATGYSGNLDFMDDENSLLVPYELVDIPKSAAPYPTTARWAEPDLDAAAKAMRWVITNPVDANQLGDRGRESVILHATISRTVDFLKSRLSEIFAAIQPLPAPPTPPTPEARPAAQLADQQISHARELINTAPNVDSPSRLPILSKPARQAMYRALAHHDQNFNERLYGLAEAVEALHHVQTQHLSDHAVESAHLKEEIRSLRATIEAREGGTDALLIRTAATDQRVASQAERIDILNRRADEISLSLTSQTERIDVLRDGKDQHALSITSQTERIDQLANVLPHVQAVVTAHGAQLYDVVLRLSEQATELTRLDIEQAADPYKSDPAALRLTGADGVTVMGYDESAGGVGLDYASFEDVYRGSEDFIAARMQGYVDLVRERGPVVDIGCGRGEFLGLLRDAGIEARGIDLDPSMVQRSTDLGLAVHLGDALDFLSDQHDESFGAVTSFQVAEHIPPESVAALFRASFRTLQPGGLMITETVNPHSPAALKTFWLDITHVRPLFPESLLFMAREAGFRSAKIMFPHVTGELQTQLRSSGEYSVLAYK